MFDAVTAENLGLEWEPCHQMLDIVSISKGGGPASGPKREREKCATKTCCSIWHEDAELGGREPLQLQWHSQRKEPDEICVAVDD